MDPYFKIEGRPLRRSSCYAGMLILAVASIGMSTVSLALDMRRVQTCSGIVLRLRGDIKLGDFDRLREHLKSNEAILGYDLSSDGGIFEEGQRIAGLTRRKKLTVYVAGECNSVCADVFFAAQKRHYASAAKIGVHSISNERDVEDLRSQRLTIKLARFWAERGVPSSAIGKMVSTRPGAITYLDEAELTELGASPGDPFETEMPRSGAQSRSCRS